MALRACVLAGLASSGLDRTCATVIKSLRVSAKNAVLIFDIKNVEILA